MAARRARQKRGATSGSSGSARGKHTRQPSKVELNVSVATTSANFNWPGECEEKLIQQVRSTLDEEENKQVPELMIIAYLKCHDETPVHTAEAIKNTLKWRAGRQMYLNHFRTQWPRYLFLHSCRSQGAGTASVFGKGRDGRLVFYEKIGSNFALPMAKEFSPSEFVELITVWCELLHNGSVLNMKPEFRKKFNYNCDAFNPVAGRRAAAEAAQLKESSLMEDDGGEDEKQSAAGGDANIKKMDIKEKIKNGTILPMIDPFSVSFDGINEHYSGQSNTGDDDFDPDFDIESDFDESRTEFGKCDHYGVIGIIDWSHCDIKTILDNLELLIAADTHITQHYPLLFHKLLHINLPKDFVNLWNELKTKVSLQTIVKSIFVGADAAIFNAKESTDGVDDANAANAGDKHTRNRSDLRARMKNYGKKKSKKEIEREKQEEAMRKQAALEDAQRKAEEEREETDKRANETAEEKRSRLKVIFEEIMRQYVPPCYGGDAPPHSLINGSKTYRNLVGLSTEPILAQYAEFSTPLEKMDEKPLRAGERHILRLNARRGDKFWWKFTLEEADNLLAFSVIFNAEGARGKSIKYTVREEAEHKCSYYPLYGDYVTPQKGKLEFQFRNNPKQRRMLLLYKIDKEKIADAFINNFIPQPPENQDPVRNRRIKHSRQRSKTSARLPRGSPAAPLKTHSASSMDVTQSDHGDKANSQPPPNSRYETHSDRAMTPGAKPPSERSMGSGLPDDDIADDDIPQPTLKRVKSADKGGIRKTKGGSRSRKSASKKGAALLGVDAGDMSRSKSQGNSQLGSPDVSMEPAKSVPPPTDPAAARLEKMKKRMAKRKSGK